MQGGDAVLGVAAICERKGLELAHLRFRIAHGERRDVNAVGVAGEIAAVGDEMDGSAFCHCIEEQCYMNQSVVAFLNHGGGKDLEEFAVFIE